VTADSIARYILEGEVAEVIRPFAMSRFAGTRKATAPTTAKEKA
jgi:hypothetical protein